jgi:exopolysaccharide production protein ExoY
VIDISATTSTKHQALFAFRPTLYARFGKRLFDLLLALLLLPVICPVILMLWLIVSCDGGAGFFGHTRIGRNGQIFRCWKIRSMVPDAELALKNHLASEPAAAREWLRSFKLDDDPRVTKFGSFVRKTSLDELPQILNVLKGEMSFVGPRPVTQRELRKYGPGKSAYLATTPGITGLWQVSGRNSTSYAERVEFDIQYVQQKSLALDLKIISKTAAAVLNQTGQ